MSEIELLFCALAGCTPHKTVHPEIASFTLPMYSYNTCSKKRAHTGCTPPKIVHPAVEMCTPGAGCTLNFGHCYVNKIKSLFLYLVFFSLSNMHKLNKIKLQHSSFPISTNETFRRSGTPPRGVIIGPKPCKQLI